MSQENKYNSADEAVAVAEVSDKETVSDVFEPREPDPSTWTIREIRFSVTQAETVFVSVIAGFLAVIMLLSAVFFGVTASRWTQPTPESVPEKEEETRADNPVKGDFADGAKGNVLYKDASAVKAMDLSKLSATHAALAKVSDGKVVAASGADTRVYPASLTKVMTLIVVAEHLRSQGSLQETVTISKDVVDAMKAEGSSGIGLAAGEKLTVEALLYDLMLQSDGIAACQLARYIAGTETEFVALMNRKAQSMGLENTHFMNPTGLHHEEHYSTCRDLATIMGYAMNMSLCRKIMTEDAFDAPCTQSNGNTFDYHIYNNLLVTHFNKYKSLTPGTAGELTIVAGKTGYTPESKYCLVTCAQDKDGAYYVCATVGADSYEDCIKAYQAIYAQYAE